MGKKTVRGHDIANRFVYSLKGAAAPLLFCQKVVNISFYLFQFSIPHVNIYHYLLCFRKDEIAHYRFSTVQEKLCLGIIQKQSKLQAVPTAAGVSFVSSREILMCIDTGMGPVNETSVVFRFYTYIEFLPAAIIQF